MLDWGRSDGEAVTVVPTVDKGRLRTTGGGAKPVATFVKVATIHELSPGQGKLIALDNKRIALFHVGERYYAIDDACPHRGGPLSEGDVEAETVICPWHGAIFALATGAVTRFPGAAGVATYAVRVQGEQIEIAV
jgi:nitrite reductase/ring-hydroxylating ferredoxin subunit